MFKTKEDIIQKCLDCRNSIYGASAILHVHVDLMKNNDITMYKYVFSQGVFKESIELAVYLANEFIKRKIKN